MSYAAKLNKFRKDPKLFFKDMFYKKSVVLTNKLKKFAPKKYNGCAKYAIISAVYNVEKYLDDFFESIINQRLDFKNNIYIICVDDGSTDNSANIIKKYQEKYPNNIIYIYKENGGQGSARNLGLEYIKQNNFGINWVTFTDPDDFLDRFYFYEVDKFLTKSSNDISMISTNQIMYYEKKKAFINNHPLNFKYKNGQKIIQNKVLDNFIELGVNKTFFKLIFIKEYTFPIDIKTFEDAYFLNMYLLDNPELKSVFLPRAIYYYRRRSDGSSTLDQSHKYDDYQTALNNRCFLLLEESYKKYGFVPKYIQNVVLYHLHWIINSWIIKNKIFSKTKEDELINSFQKVFTLIDSETIENFNIGIFSNLHKIGILGLFKNESPSKLEFFIKDCDKIQNQILVSYYTYNHNDKIQLNTEVKYKKIVQYNFLGKVFVYENYFWIKIPKNLEYFNVFINNTKANIIFNSKRYENLPFNKIYNIYPKIDKNIWLLCDKDTLADDNAEHLYRYIIKNHPEINAYFALRKNSPHWNRLQQEGFNLLEWGSLKFLQIYKKAGIIASSHIDGCLVEYFGNKSLYGKKFIFLQHGIIKDDLSTWLNDKKINLFITSTINEYHSICDDFNLYKFGKKEVLLSGLARHDALLANNKPNSKNILIMPTWRGYLAGDMIAGSGSRKCYKNFISSEYFVVYKSLLHNKKLKEFSDNYGYTFIFNPHSNIMPHLKDFELPSYIKIADGEKSIQELFATSDLMITDYSSVAFEMAYLGKPVIYYQFDEKSYRQGHLRRGYFDYRKDGFGPVVSTEFELFAELENMLKNSCKPTEPYLSNIKNTFAFKDGKCCERICNAIIELNKEEI